jgi:hypothetical protein
MAVTAWSSNGLTGSQSAAQWKETDTIAPDGVGWIDETANGALHAVSRLLTKWTKDVYGEWNALARESGGQ